MSTASLSNQDPSSLTRRKLERDQQLSWGFLFAGVGLIAFGLLIVLFGIAFRTTFVLIPPGLIAVMLPMAVVLALVGAACVAINGWLLRKERPRPAS